MPTMSQRVLSLIRSIPNHPKPGIVFKDITPVLEDAQLFLELIHHFGRRYSHPKHKNKLKKIVAIESRGFIFGSALAFYLGVGLVLIRKAGKLPWDKISKSYDLEYGKDTIEIHTDSIQTGEHVIICDDILATGKTTKAAIHLVEQLGGHVLECAFLFEIEGLGGVDTLADYEVYSSSILPRE